MNHKLNAFNNCAKKIGLIKYHNKKKKKKERMKRAILLCFFQLVSLKI